MRQLEHPKCIYLTGSKRAQCKKNKQTKKYFYDLMMTFDLNTIDITCVYVGYINNLQITTE